jgi:hypothetical protein
MIHRTQSLRVINMLLGKTHSPDAKILFANIQEPGYLFAITGPWRRRR